jgi:hypothetical protein
VAIHAWLFVYWIAAMVNLSFDPYLEGPHGGIWFWALFGLGLGSMRAWKADPEEDAVVAAAATTEPEEPFRLAHRTASAANAARRG